ncbi:hypothetical protein ACFL4G_05475 [Thermodesulfobacteriota bacterium]
MGSKSIMAVISLAAFAVILNPRVSVSAGETEIKKVKGREFKVEFHSRKEISIGEETIIKVFIFPKKKWKINLQYPSALRVVSADGFSVKRGILKRADAHRYDEKELRFEIQMMPRKEGNHRVHLTVDFALCVGSRCILEKVEEEISFTLRRGE